MPLSLQWFQMHFADHIVGIMICIIAPFLVAGTRRLAEPEVKWSSDEKIGLYHQNGLFLIVLALTVITVWRLPARTLVDIGFGWPVWSGAAAVLLAVAVGFYSLDLIFQFGLRQRRPKTIQEGNEGASVILPANRIEFAHFIFLSLAAGLGEEVIFRGFLMHYLVFWFGHTPADILAAAFVSSLLFAYLHGYQGWPAMVKIFFLAILFAAIFIVTRSLWPVIFLHTLIDIVSGWLGLRLYRSASADDPSGGPVD